MKGKLEYDQPEAKTFVPFQEVKEDDVKAKVIKARGWLLTLPADEYSQQDVESNLSKYSYIGQLEKGKNNSEANPDGYLHYQMYVETENAIRFSTLKKMFPKGHFEIRKGTVKQAYEYCSKTDTRIGEPFSNGDLSIFIEKAMKLRDYLDLINRGMTVNQILVSYPMAIVHEKALDGYQRALRYDRYSSTPRDDLRVSYVWGKTGVGKTYSIYEAHGYENVYVVSDYSHPFDDYDFEPVIVFDEFRGQLPIGLMLQILDPYPKNLGARYKNKVAGFTKVYVVSNIPLTSQYPNVKETERETWEAFSNRFDSVMEKQGENHRAKKRRERDWLDFDLINLAES